MLAQGIRTILTDRVESLSSLASNINDAREWFEHQSTESLYTALDHPLDPVGLHRPYWLCHHSHQSPP